MEKKILKGKSYQDVSGEMQLGKQNVPEHREIHVDSAKGSMGIVDKRRHS